MNDIQNLIDRELGNYCRLNYDNVLKRLVVYEDEAFYGLQSGSAAGSFEQDPPIFACRFAETSGYKNILALANEDGRVAIQDTTSSRTASRLESFQCHNNAVFDLAWMPGHMNFVTVSGDHTACVWDVSAGGPRRAGVLAQHGKSVKCAAFRPRGGPLLATGGRDGHVLVWDLRQPRPAAALRPDNRLLSCHAAFAPARGKRPRPERAASVTGLAFRDDFALLSCGECDGNIKVWDLRKNYSAYDREPLPKLSIPYCGSSAKNGYTDLVVDEAGVRLYASCMDDVVYCFNVSAYSPQPERRYVGHESGSFYVKICLSPDGRYLVSGSSDRRAYVWRVGGAEPVARLAAHRAEVTCAAWAAGGGALATCGDDARHLLWRPRAGPRARSPLGRAEPAPPRLRAPALRSPPALRRPADTQPDGPARKTKRCLVDLLDATREAHGVEPDVKRMKLDDGENVEGELLPSGIKRAHPGGSEASPAKRVLRENTDWTYPARAGSSFLTPTKKYEHRSCKIISPKSLKDTSPNAHVMRSPDSPNKVRIVTFTTPTKDLPNFVLNGEAPHLRLMSPIKKKQETTDWLTKLREKRGKVDIEKCQPSPLSPKENIIPTRRNSVEKTPKSVKKKRTLLTYFTVTPKDS